MIHSGSGRWGYWRWMGVLLCPLCRVARLDFWLHRSHQIQWVHQPR